MFQRHKGSPELVNSSGTVTAICQSPQPIHAEINTPDVIRLAWQTVVFVINVGKGIMSGFMAKIIYGTS